MIDVNKKPMIAPKPVNGVFAGPYTLKDGTTTESYTTWLADQLPNGKVPAMKVDHTQNPPVLIPERATQGEASPRPRPTVDDLYPIRPAEPIPAFCQHCGCGECGLPIARLFMTDQPCPRDVPAPPAAGDPINPGYYKRGGIEAADVIEAFDLNWRLGTAVKHLLRAGHKTNTIEDLEKAIWYISREATKLRERAQS